MIQLIARASGNTALSAEVRRPPPALHPAFEICEPQTTNRKFWKVFAGYFSDFCIIEIRITSPTKAGLLTRGDRQFGVS
jgi:hypothetical protein